MNLVLEYLFNGESSHNMDELSLLFVELLVTEVLKHSNHMVIDGFHHLLVHDVLIGSSLFVNGRSGDEVRHVSLIVLTKRNCHANANYFDNIVVSLSFSQLAYCRDFRD